MNPRAKEEVKNKYRERFKHSQFINHSAIEEFVVEIADKMYMEGYREGVDIGTKMH